MENSGLHTNAKKMLEGCQGMMGEVLQMQKDIFSKMTPEEKQKFFKTLKGANVSENMKAARDKLKDALKTK